MYRCRRRAVGVAVADVAAVAAALVQARVGAVGAAAVYIYRFARAHTHMCVYFTRMRMKARVCCAVRCCAVVQVCGGQCAHALVYVRTCTRMVRGCAPRDRACLHRHAACSERACNGDERAGGGEAWANPHPHPKVRAGLCAQEEVRHGLTLTLTLTLTGTEVACAGEERAGGGVWHGSVRGNVRAGRGW